MDRRKKFGIGKDCPSFPLLSFTRMRRIVAGELAGARCPMVEFGLFRLVPPDEDPGEGGAGPCGSKYRLAAAGSGQMGHFQSGPTRCPNPTDREWRVSRQTNARGSRPGRVNKERGSRARGTTVESKRKVAGVGRLRKADHRKGVNRRTIAGTLRITTADNATDKPQGNVRVIRIGAWRRICALRTAKQKRVVAESERTSPM